jgi:hypothetical protein
MERLAAAETAYSEVFHERSSTCECGDLEANEIRPDVYGAHEQPDGHSFSLTATAPVLRTSTEGSHELEASSPTAPVRMARLPMRNIATTDTSFGSNPGRLVDKHSGTPTAR